MRYSRPPLLTLLGCLLAKSASGDIEDKYKQFHETLSTKAKEGFSEDILGTTVYFHGDFNGKEEQNFVTSKTRAYIELASTFDQKEPPTYCTNHNDALHLYFVPRETINNRSIMHFLMWSKWDNKNIYGAFDSTHSPAGTATVFVSSTHPRGDIDLTIKHEIYHYWQFRTCQGLSEAEAYKFEEFSTKESIDDGAHLPKGQPSY